MHLSKGFLFNSQFGFCVIHNLLNDKLVINIIKINNLPHHSCITAFSVAMVVTLQQKMTIRQSTLKTSHLAHISVILTVPLHPLFQTRTNILYFKFNHFKDNLVVKIFKSIRTWGFEVHILSWFASSCTINNLIKQTINQPCRPCALYRRGSYGTVPSSVKPEQTPSTNLINCLANLILK